MADINQLMTLGLWEKKNAVMVITVATHELAHVPSPAVTVLLSNVAREGSAPKCPSCLKSILALTGPSS